jgi:hypothetical protein
MNERIADGKSEKIYRYQLEKLIKAIIAFPFYCGAVIRIGLTIV